MKKFLLPTLFLLTFALPTWADTRYELRVDGLACPYCAYGIEKKLKALDGIQKTSLVVDLDSGRIDFSLRGNATVDEPTLKELVNDAGFTLRSMETREISTEEGK